MQIIKEKDQNLWKSVDIHKEYYRIRIHMYSPLIQNIPVWWASLYSEALLHLFLSVPEDSCMMS